MRIGSGDWEGAEVYIESNGVRLPEHAVKHAPATRGVDGSSSLHVECAVGQPFAITFAQTDPPRDVRMTCTIDGVKMGCAVLKKDASRRMWCTYEMVDGVMCTRELTFGAVTLTEDAAAITEERLKAMGKITVVLEDGQFELAWRGGREKETKLDSGPINEKVKKGMLGMTVAGGKATPAQESNFYDFYKGTRADYTVTFSYQSKDLLMAQGIIPNPRPAVQEEAVQEDRKPRIKRERVRTDSNAVTIDLTRGPPKRIRKSIQGTSELAAIEVREEAGPAGPQEVIDLTQ